MSAPASLGIGLLLIITSSVQNPKILVCLTGVVLGGSAFLISADIMLISLCGYKSSKDCIKKVVLLLRNNRFLFTCISLLKDGILVVVKAIISILSISVFMFINALYSVGMGLAKTIALKMRSQSSEEQLKSYRNIGLIILLSSLCYVFYSIRLFIGGTTRIYELNIALVIALYTFIEFGINIRDAIRIRKSKALEMKALRAISFSSTLLCFVLTQTAILSFSEPKEHSYANALSGVIFGSCAALVGLYVIVRSYLLKHKNEDYLFKTEEN